jgi:hypothetical protein
MKELKNGLKNYMLKEMVGKLYEYEDTKHYACDLGYSLFEYDNINGTYTYSTCEAKEWIKEYWEDIGDVVEEMKFQMGADNIPNVFENPERFMVVIMLEVSSYMLSKCPFIDTNWNDEIILSRENIEIIVKELQENNDTYEIYK